MSFIMIKVNTDIRLGTNNSIQSAMIHIFYTYKLQIIDGIDNRLNHTLRAG